MTKQARLLAIKEIISSKPITRQHELRRELQKRGLRVTQATLSRDIRDLGVSRVAFGKTARYVLEPVSEAQILRPLVGAEILSIDSNESIIVIRTLPACANTVGEFIDVQKHADIIGTVAGDNTLLVIPRSQKKTNRVLAFLKNKLTEGG